MIFSKKDKKEGSAIASVSINTILMIKVPKETEVKQFETLSAPIAAEQMFASLHGLLKFTPDIQEHISFEIAADKKGVTFYCGVPEHLKSYVESQIYAQYPQAQISICADHFLESEEDTYKSKTLKLAKEQFFPIKTFRAFEVDPLSPLTSALEEISQGCKAHMQLLIRPIPDVWQAAGYAYVEAVRNGLLGKGWGLGDVLKSFTNELGAIVMNVPRRMTYSGELEAPKRSAGPAEAKMPVLSTSQKNEIEAIENKISKLGFECIVRIGVWAKENDVAEMKIRSLMATFKQFSTANLNSFEDSGHSSFSQMKERHFNNNESFVLNTEELASLFHLPSVALDTPSINWSLAKRGEPPLNLPIDNCTYFGYTTFRERKVKFGIRNDNGDRDRHMYLVGKTGTGKSTVFRNMIIQDMKDGHGVGVIDPHGELIDHILESVPANRVDDVVIFDPSDFQFPVGFNMLECTDPNQKHLMASGLLSAFKKHFTSGSVGVSWGPRLEYLLNYAILTLLEVPGTTMLGIVRVLMDDNYRKYILHKVKDPVILEFWEKEFKNMKGNQSLISESLSPIQNKVGRFLSSSVIRNILGQRNSSFNLLDLMNNKKIFLVNLAKGKIGEDNANLLGSLMVSHLFFNVMQRVRVPEKDRVPFYLFVDEFQNFASDSFASILSEARKFRLSLHLTHQYTAQLPEEMLESIFGNVGTMVALTLGAQDAKVLEPEFAPIFTENDLITLERRHFYVKLMINGMTSPPFSGESLPLPAEIDFTGLQESIIEKSRQKYGRNYNEVEQKIKTWIERPFDLGMAIAEEHKSKKEEVVDEKKVEDGINPEQKPEKDKEDLNGTVFLR